MDWILASYECIGSGRLLVDHEDFWRRLALDCARSTELVRQGMHVSPSEYQPAQSRPFRDDDLLMIEPAVYVEKLAHVQVPRSGMIVCPFPGHADRNRSMKVYTEPERGVWCFGCLKGGSIYDFAAALWGYETRGDAFTALRRQIAEAMLK
jgi:hypothetical protein